MIWYRLLTLWQVERDHVGRLSVAKGGFENRLPELRSQWLDLGPGAPTSKDNLNDFYNHPELCRTLNANFLRTIPHRSSPLLASELSCELDAGPIPVLILRRSLDDTRIVFTTFYFLLIESLLDFLGKSSLYGGKSSVSFAMYYFLFLNMLLVTQSSRETRPYHKPSKVQVVMPFAVTVICGKRLGFLSSMGGVLVFLFSGFVTFSIVFATPPSAFDMFLEVLFPLLPWYYNGRSKKGFCRTIFRCVRAPDQVSDSDDHC
jgi:hypothetical protein